jgi:hypothetical protein
VEVVKPHQRLRIGVSGVGPTCGQHWCAELSAKGSENEIGRKIRLPFISAGCEAVKTLMEKTPVMLLGRKTIRADLEGQSWYISAHTRTCHR